jgi:hypothetical protein
MEGTGSGASSSMLSGFSVLVRSRSMSFSMLSRIAYLRARRARSAHSFHPPSNDLQTRFLRDAAVAHEVLHQGAA